MNIAIATGPASAVLNGTLSAKVLNGIATFSNLSLNLAAAYTLMATDGSLTSAQSSSNFPQHGCHVKGQGKAICFEHVSGQPIDR